MKRRTNPILEALPVAVQEGFEKGYPAKMIADEMGVPVGRVFEAANQLGLRFGSRYVSKLRSRMESMPPREALSAVLDMVEVMIGDDSQYRLPHPVDEIIKDMAPFRKRIVRAIVHAPLGWITYEQILNVVYADRAAGDVPSITCIRTQLFHIRKAIAGSALSIENVWGEGYRAVWAPETVAIRPPEITLATN